MQTIHRRLIPLLALLTLALIPAQADAAKTSQASATQQASRAATAFDYAAQANKLSQPRYETEQQVIQLPAYDGELLYIEVTKPKAAGHWPTILEASPYHGTIADRDGTRILPCPTNADGDPIGLTGYFAPRGYAVVMMDLRGTGRSQGCLEPPRRQGRARPRAGDPVGREPGLVERPCRHDGPFVCRLDAVRRGGAAPARAQDDRAERRPGLDVPPPVPGGVPYMLQWTGSSGRTTT